MLPRQDRASQALYLLIMPW